MTNARYRITFGKGRELRFTGHLDLHRAWDRTFRRANLSLAYSEGFSPRPKINIGAALPLGCTSEADLVDVELVQEVEITHLIEPLSASAPPGLTISEITTVPNGSPKLQKILQSSEYLIPILVEDRGRLEARIETMLTSAELPRARRGKEYDLRPLIEEMGLADPQEAELQTAAKSGETVRPMELKLRLMARSGATGRPDEVLRALELDPTPLVPHRVRLILGAA
jgi:radical SAM-linked protein